MNEIEPNETEIIGTWSATREGNRENENCRRIRHLITTYLIKLGPGQSSGWEILCRDPKDGRLWELTYPHGYMHGGGPPRLSVISIDEARSKYGAAAVEV